MEEDSGARGPCSRATRAQGCKACLGCPPSGEKKKTTTKKTTKNPPNNQKNTNQKHHQKNNQQPLNPMNYRFPLSVAGPGQGQAPGEAGGEGLLDGCARARVKFRAIPGRTGKGGVVHGHGLCGPLPRPAEEAFLPGGRGVDPASTRPVLWAGELPTCAAHSYYRMLRAGMSSLGISRRQKVSKRRERGSPAPVHFLQTGTETYQGGRRRWNSGAGFVPRGQGCPCAPGPGKISRQPMAGRG